MKKIFSKIILAVGVIFTLLANETFASCPTITTFSVMDIGSCKCQTEQFTVAFDPGITVNVLWKFGDGSTSFVAGVTNSATVSHYYSSAGTYVAWVKIIGPGACADSLSMTLPISCHITGCESIDFFSHVPVASNDPCSYFEFNMAICKDTVNWTTDTIPFIWDFGDGITQLDTVKGAPRAINHAYGAPGTYTATITVYADPCVLIRKDKVVVTCSAPPCTDCISSFAPVPGKRYVLSAWVKEDNPPQSKTSYNYPSITVTYPSLVTSIGPFYGTGNIIDGWQRVETSFVIPPLATDIGIKLDCASGNCFFDDIRFQPFDGSMKSYVYDPVNLRLVAELDERNYATMYEYDEEGKLIRVKKETEKGIMTIKENRNNTHKN